MGLSGRPRYFTSPTTPTIVSQGEFDVETAHLDALADRASTGPEARGHVLADDHDVASPARLLFEERPAGLHRNLERREEIGRRAVDVRAWPLLRVHGRLPFRGVEHGARQPAERRIRNEARGGDARQRAHPLEEHSGGNGERARACRHHRGPTRGMLTRAVRTCRGVEAGIDRGEVLDGPDHQAGADEQHHGERNFRDDQAAPQALTPPSGAAARRILQRLRQPTDASVHRRRQPEQQCACGADGNREGRDPRVHVRRARSSGS